LTIDNLKIPSAPLTEEELEEELSRPTPGVMEVLATLPGDLLVLGAGGKMGPSLARMARRGLGERHRVIAVSRFRDPASRRLLEQAGITIISADLRDPAALAALPEVADLIFMAGQKFGTHAAPSETWAMNALVPALVAARYPGRRFVVFSTGNVYPLVPASSKGAPENHPLGPIGEYAMSCVARERLFEDAAIRDGTRATIFRLNYANDLRYGVLVDLARRVLSGEPVDLSMGQVNLIWQGDANARALQCLALASSPATILNVTGPEVLSVRALAKKIGEYVRKEPMFTGAEASDALLSDASRSLELFGPPVVSVDTMIQWTVSWLQQGGRVLHKPTHFEERYGQF
jgi:nucleoside-diphosphate-sugar epimerase